MSVIEILSDSSLSSNDTIIGDEEIPSILSKYDVYGETNNRTKKQQSVIDNVVDGMFNDDEDFPDISLDNQRSAASTSSATSSIDITLKYLLDKYKTNEMDSNTVPETSVIEVAEKLPAKRAKTSLSNKEQQLQDKALKQAEKQKQREQKKKEVETEKQIKQAMKEAHKHLKPDECMKHIIVCIDLECVNEIYGSQILTTLQASDITYKVESEIIPNTVSWKRKVQTHLMAENGKLAVSSEVTDTDQVLLLMNCSEIIELIHSKELITHIQNIQSLLLGKTIFLGIYGMRYYYRFQKAKKQRELQDNNMGTQKIDRTYQNLPEVTNKSIEFALTELQLRCSCCHRMVDTAKDVAEMIYQFTKSVAQIPYKLEKHKKDEKGSWYMQGDNKDCVRIDRFGNGFKRLWQQQLTTFPLASLETAEAIMSKFPVPHALMKTYDECSSKVEAEQLLQDIPIRRAAGPLTTVKKIGPELSKKIYTFFNTTNPCDIIH